MLAQLGQTLRHGTARASSSFVGCVESLLVCQPGHMVSALAGVGSEQRQQATQYTSASCQCQGTTRPSYHATTILCIRKADQVFMIGDGQVSIGNMVAKPNANKLRRIGDSVIAGFAGSAADGLSLIERLEAKVEEHPGQLMRACVELAKMWRQDKAMRFLEAQLLVADANMTLTVSGNGDVLEPQDGVMGIGSGSPYAIAAARALMDVPGMDAATIAGKAMRIAASMCVYTNDNFLTQSITAAPPGTPTPPP